MQQNPPPPDQPTLHATPTPKNVGNLYLYSLMEEILQVNYSQLKISTAFVCLFFYLKSLRAIDLIDS